MAPWRWRLQQTRSGRRGRGENSDGHRSAGGSDVLASSPCGGGTSCKRGERVVGALSLGALQDGGGATGEGRRKRCRWVGEARA